MVEIRKDVRKQTSSITILVSPNTPPIMEIKCADKLLCPIGDGGNLFINPTSRLALKGLCIEKENSDCSDMSYDWSIMKPGQAFFN